jgi:outer membrane protein OmpA-like peptidoglycan-associated protein
LHRFAAIPATLALVLASPAAAQAIDLSLPQGAELTATHSQTAASHALPTGPYQNGAVDMRVYDAAMNQTAHRMLRGQAHTTQSILLGLKAQILDLGYRTDFECFSTQCGGFDFRFALDLLPEPDMHVDLADFRYFQATKGAGNGLQVVALVVSASPKYGFVHITQLGQGIGSAAKMTEASKSPEPAAENSPFAAGKTVVLQGVTFAAGKAEVQGPPPAALDDLARWLAANPQTRATLIGHTDSTGNVDANSALSLARASALRDVLVARYGIDPARLSVIGRGGDAPIASNDTRDGRAENRRVEVRIDAAL